MGLMATEGGSGGDFTPAPEGTHIGRCVKVIDLGTQPGSQMYPDPKHKVMVAWELPSELHEYNGEQLPFLVTTRRHRCGRSWSRGAVARSPRTSSRAST